MRHSVETEYLTRDAYRGATSRAVCLRKFLPKTVLAGVALQAVAMSSAALAQTQIAAATAPAANQLAGLRDEAPAAEILVTAQRRLQSVEDVPASVAAVSGASLAQRSIVTVNDLSSVVSNLQISNPYGPGAPPAFNIRGISSTDFSATQSRPIAVYIDEGIRQLPSLEVAPLFDVDHIEVLRGPQGALYGKNATGGAINIINKTPGFDTSGYVQAGYGNFNRRETNGAVQTSLIPDVVAVRLAYTYVKDHGTIQNVFPGNPDVNQTDLFGVRGTILVKPSASLQIVARLTHSYSGGRGPGIYGDNASFAQVGFAALATVPGSSRQGLGFFQNDQDYIGRRNLRTDGVNIQITDQLTDAISLMSITTYDRGKWVETVDTDGLAVDQEHDFDDAHGERQFVQELRLTGQYGPLKLLLGVFYSFDKIDMHYQYTYYSDPACGAACRSDVLLGLDDGSRGFVASNAFTQRRHSYSGYGRAEYDLTNQLTLAGGLRWSHDRVGVANFTAYNGDVADPEAYQTIAPTDLAKSFSNVSGEAVLTWKPHPGLTTYASFKQGYRTGAINAQAYYSPEEITVAKPETANSWEIGVKTMPFGPALTLNLAAFYAQYRNQQITSLEELGPLVIYPLRSIDRSRIYGLEADAVLRLSHALTVSGSLGYTNGEYTKGQVGGESVAGNQLTNSAKWSANGSVDWTVAQIGDGSLVLHADAAYQSKVYFDVHETPTITDNGHVVTGASATFDIGKFSFSAWVTNLLNSHYFTYGLDTSYEGFTYRLRGEPRQFGGRVGVRF